MPKHIHVDTTSRSAQFIRCVEGVKTLVMTIEFMFGYKEKLLLVYQ